MNFLSWTLAMGLFLGLFSQSLKLHEATVCRQEAYRGGTILLTQNLLSYPRSQDGLVNPSCHLTMLKKGHSVTWWRQGRLPKLFELNLRGKM